MSVMKGSASGSASSPERAGAGGSRWKETDGLTGVAGRRDVGDGYGYGDAVAGQAAGELNHGVEVAPDHPCVQHHGAAHFLDLYVPVIYVRSDQWGLYIAEWLP